MERKSTTSVWSLGALLSIALIGVAISEPGTAAVFRVGDGGPGGGCHTSSVQTAIDMAAATPGAHEIRLERLTNGGFYYEDILIDNDLSSAQLTISGGWTSCTDTVRTGARSIVYGIANSNHFGPFAIYSTANPPQKHVILRDLEIYAGVSSGGEQWAVDVAGTRLDLFNVFVQDGEPGIVAYSGASVFIDSESLIAGNTSTSPTYGGAVTCGRSTLPSEPGTTVEIYGRLIFNEAVNGGALQVRQGCTVTLQPGAQVAYNFASSQGGGAYVTAGGDLYVGAATFSQNHAVAGGGLYATGLGSTVFMSNVRFVGNTATTGGAIATADRAFLRMARSPGTICYGPPYCSQIDGNEASSSQGGSAALVTGASRVEILQTMVKNQSGSATPAGVLKVEGANTELYLEGVAFWNNLGSSLMAATGGSITGGFLSAAKNSWTLDAGGNPTIRVWIASASGGATVNLEAGVFVDTRGSSGPNITGRCLMVNDGSNMVLGNSVVNSNLNPRFVDAEAGNLHLSSISPAIDFCDSHFPPTAPDIDLHPRAFDSPNVLNGIGSFDLGFDEYIGAGGNPAIFANGFESGNTSAWSSTTP